MTLSSKRELIQAIRKVYGKSTKAQKSAHLDHLELVTGLKRNYLNRLLLSGYKTKRRKPGRRSRYASDPEFMEALKRIWGATRYLSGKLLKRSIKFYIATYQVHCGVLAPDVSEKLLRISPATIDRILLPTKRRLRIGKPIAFL
jgi:hypothetical protein